MFKWPKSPSGNAPPHEIADYVEMCCWRDSTVSVMDVRKDLGRLNENDHSDGVQETSDVEDKVGYAFHEIENRERMCRGGYPFYLDENGTLYRNDSHENDREASRRATVYLFLLLATRLNMKTHRQHAEIDGTLLFEYLSAETARSYFGERAESYVFGTSHPGSFRDKIDELCRLMGEGGGFESQDGTSRIKDGGLDVVAWKHFEDRAIGKLIGFGQCKTGTSYADNWSILYPDIFVKTWMDGPVVQSIRMFFVAEALSRSSWRKPAMAAGLLFDRCRIIDYCDDLNKRTYRKIVRWTTGAAAASELPTERLG